MCTFKGMACPYHKFYAEILFVLKVNVNIPLVWQKLGA